MRDLATIEKDLRAQLTELTGRRARIAHDLYEPPSRDSDDLAIEREDDESLEHQGALVDREIISVKRALARIEKGTYGQCARCGDAIAPERLEARPEAALCIACAQSPIPGAHFGRQSNP